MLDQPVFELSHFARSFNYDQVSSSTQHDTEMEEEDEDDCPLSKLCKEFDAAATKQKQEEEGDSDWEEVDDFDPEYSVFGSEKATVNERSVLGKRQRDLDYETVETDEEITCLAGPSKKFHGVSGRELKTIIRPTILRPIMRK